MKEQMVKTVTDPYGRFTTPLGAPVTIRLQEGGKHYTKVNFEIDPAFVWHKDCVKSLIEALEVLHGTMKG